MSTTDRFATLGTNIANAFSSLFSFSFNFSYPRNRRLELEEPTLPKTPPPRWWQRVTHVQNPDVRPGMSAHLMDVRPPSQALRDPAQIQADLQKYTPEGARYAKDMDRFEDVFQRPTVPHSQRQPVPAFHLGRPPPAPDSWREHIASTKPLPQLPTQQVVAQKRKRAEAPVRTNRGWGNRRGNNGEPVRKKARL